MFGGSWQPRPHNRMMVPPYALRGYTAEDRNLYNVMPAAGAKTKKRPSAAAPEPSAKRARIEKPAPNLVKPSPIVTVHVRKGEEDEYTTFSVHNNYICHYSPFFQAAFNGNFQEGQKKEMHLEETDPHVFGIFASWLYTQKIQNENGEIPECGELIDLWIFGDRYLMPRLQNQALIALDQARTKAKKLSSSLYKAIYDGTNPQSHLRLYLIDYCVNSTVEISCPESYPIQLLVDIINTTRAERRGNDKATRRWDMLPEEMEDYFVDENVDLSTEQRHGLSEGVNRNNFAEKSTALATDLSPAKQMQTAATGSSQTLPDPSFSSVDLVSDDDDTVNEIMRSFRSTA